MSRRPVFGIPKLGTLIGWRLCNIFDTVVVIGWMGSEHFFAHVLCFDGKADDDVSFLWTDKGRARVLRDERMKWLVGV